MSQISPKSPVAIKAHRHPNCMAIKGTANGAMIAPMFDPELNIPTASALSLSENHSETALIALGKLPASPRPRKNLDMAKVLQTRQARETWLQGSR